MSQKYGISCEYCNVLLKNEDDIFGTNFGQLFHSTCMGGINQGKSTDCQPLMSFRMNLKFANTPTLTTEAEGECGIVELKNSNNAAVQKLKTKIKTLEDALLVKDHLKDDVNKLMDCVVKLANTLSINVDDKAAGIANITAQHKSNKQDYDENNLNGDDLSLTEEEDNIEQNNSNNGVLQSVQQLEARIKTLKDALLQSKSDGNKLTDCVETVGKDKVVDNTPGDGNNITQDPKANKETPNENNLSAEQYNDTGTGDSEENHTCTVTEEEQEVLDLRRNCVLIEDSRRFLYSLDDAFSCVRDLANEMNAEIADNSVIYIDMYYPNWYVYFRDADSKNEFLKNRFIYEYNPYAGHHLRILDYTNCGIADIDNFQSSDLSLETAFVNVDELATKMGMANIRNYIDHIDVYSPEPNFLTYSIRFNRQDMKNMFVQKKNILKEFPETKSLIILDVGGHRSSFYKVDNFSMTTVSTNVIGVAELMGLSLSNDNFKRIYVLNTRIFENTDKYEQVSLLVEFSSNDIKEKFLKNASELNLNPILNSHIYISDVKPEGKIVAIKYYKDPYDLFSPISFIGLAKQLGFSFPPDQTERFINLSQFILRTSS